MWRRGEQTISFLFGVYFGLGFFDLGFDCGVCKKLKYFFGNSLQVNLDLNKIMTTVMLSAFNHMPFTMVAEDTWSIADEMLEMSFMKTAVDDDETTDEETVDDDETGDETDDDMVDEEETADFGDKRIDVQVFYRWNNVVTEFVNTFSKFIR